MSAYKPYQRSDPGKLAKEREAIRKSKEGMNRPSLGQTLMKIPGAIDQYLMKKVKQKRERAGGYGPSPAIEGAYVKGLPSDISGAVTSLKSKKKSLA